MTHILRVNDFNKNNKPQWLTQICLDFNATDMCNFKLCTNVDIDRRNTFNLLQTYFRGFAKFLM